MRLAPLGHALSVLFLLATAALTPTLAEEQTPSTDAGTPRAGMASPSSQPKVLTGKERLGKKWMDEQRLDNCKVPIEKRGSKPRPDTCANNPTG